MPLAAIKRNDYREPDRAAAQDRAIASVERDPEKHIAAYLADPRSFGGRYVAADLFKETFDDYRATKVAGDGKAGPIYDEDSRARRSRNNAPVHNAAAVLSAEQFERACASAQPGQPAVFLTGSPGSGKTTFVLNQDESGKLRLPENFGVVFEGQLSRPEPGIEKIERALKAGLAPVIIAVHATPEKALDNTLHRFESQGRGSSMKLMSEISGTLPDGLQKIHDHFQAKGQRVDLVIHDNRDYTKQTSYSGWDHLPVLKSEGSQKDILERHERHLEARWNAGTVRADAYRQAAGHEPPERRADRPIRDGLGERAGTAGQPHGHGPGAPPQGRAAQLLGPEASQRALAAAEAIGRRIGGDQAKTTPALDGHAYRGPIVGDTGRHVIQGGSTLTSFIAHERDRLAPTPQVGRVVDVSYPQDRSQPARVTELAITKTPEKTPPAPNRDDGLDR